MGLGPGVYYLRVRGWGLGFLGFGVQCLGFGVRGSEHTAAWSLQSPSETFSWQDPALGRMACQCIDPTSPSCPAVTSLQRFEGWGVGFMVYSLLFGVKGFRFRVYGLVLKVWGVGFRVNG